ncbi:triose-phosphate isomerase family protein [Raineyella sp. LH-20]|uniref:triose-phosphate isomerase family protein n=1 Tax=Raineyella sp. LH-20 TaxID=3081204 RepID=UPI002953B3FE|nr:triose-phosphate isomerase family protein [Raineyella sp. LH-20]WOP19093.1 triose-phosphate isomerase family protein [Raineyella sp. LH-20]
MTDRRIVLGTSLKMYFGHQQTLRWASAVADILAASPAVETGQLEFFLAPAFPALPETVRIFAPHPVAAQDVAAAEPGAFTGEVSAAELAEIGVRLVEIGHAERRRLFGETDAQIATKCAMALAHGLTPVLCVGEPELGTVAEAARVVVDQVDAALAAPLRDTPDRRVIVAYEPQWAIGAAEPAPADRIRAICDLVRDELRERYSDLVLLYGGSAGPGTLTGLGDAVDGLFLGRFVHDPRNVARVVDEAGRLLGCPTPAPAS